MKLVLDNGVVKVSGETPSMKLAAELRLPITPVTSMLPQKFERIVTQAEAERLTSELFQALADMMMRG